MTSGSSNDGQNAANPRLLALVENSFVLFCRRRAAQSLISSKINTAGEARNQVSTLYVHVPLLADFFFQLQIACIPFFQGVRFFLLSRERASLRRTAAGDRRSFVNAGNASFTIVNERRAVRARSTQDGAPPKAGPAHPFYFESNRAATGGWSKR